MALVYVVWLVGALSAALGVVLTLHPPQTKYRKIWCWAIFVFLTLAGLWIAIQQKQEEDTKDRNQSDLENSLRGSVISLTKEVHKATSTIDELALASGITLKGGLNEKLDYVLKNLGTTKVAVENLAAISEAEQEYHDEAILNMIGKPAPDGDIVYTSPISKGLEGSYTIKGTQITYKIDAEAERIFRDEMEKFPKFPFSYAGLAICLKNRGDNSWREYADKGAKIFEKTILVPGHHPNHDLFLKYLREMIAQ